MLLLEGQDMYIEKCRFCNRYYWRMARNCMPSKCTYDGRNIVRNDLDWGMEEWTSYVSIVECVAYRCPPACKKARLGLTFGIKAFGADIH